MDLPLEVMLAVFVKSLWAQLHETEEAAVEILRQAGIMKKKSPVRMDIVLHYISMLIRCKLDVSVADIQEGPFEEISYNSKTISTTQVHTSKQTGKCAFITCVLIS